MTNDYVTIDLTAEQARYLLALLDPIVAALDAADHENSVAWQCERALDGGLVNWEEDHSEID